MTSSTIFKHTDVAGDSIEVQEYITDVVVVARSAGSDVADYVHVLIPGANSVALYKALKKHLRSTGQIKPKKGAKQ